MDSRKFARLINEQSAATLFYIKQWEAALETINNLEDTILSLEARLRTFETQRESDSPLAADPVLREPLHRMLRRRISELEKRLEDVGG